MNYDLFIAPVAGSGRESTARSAWSGNHTTAARDNRPAEQDVAAVATPWESASEQLKSEDLTSAVAAFNDVFQQADVSVRYRIDDATNDLVISLVDTQNDEIVRQIPSEEILKMRQRLEDLLGIIFDATA